MGDEGCVIESIGAFHGEKKKKKKEVWLIKEERRMIKNRNRRHTRLGIKKRYPKP